jgi:hypothetical protein
MTTEEEPNLLNDKEEEERDRIITQITLDCLLNKEQYMKYLNASTFKALESSKRDRKFYKRRILQMARDLLLSDEINAPNDMLFAFDHFARICISYFKMIDKTDILQTDYPPIVNEQIVSELPPFKDSAESLMRSIKINAITMDKFVKRTSTATTIKPVIPQMKDINLKDPELRNKGIRKKNNINNKYEDSSEKKETDETDKTK